MRFLFHDRISWFICVNDNLEMSYRDEWIIILY